MNSMFKTISLFVLLSFSTASFAGEGMWLPLLLKALNESEMQSMGMKLTAEDIYSINKGSLKDAIVHFGGFCTSEIISDKGLMLTNHHCGYGQIQSHSTIDNNLLKNGFWAKSMNDELPNTGLTATLIDRIEDITEKALEGVTPDMDTEQRQSTIDKNLSRIKQEYVLADYQEAVLKPFFNGNQYFAFITTIYKDIRLVGAPPESIGKFGSDTDNWVWPRHTGDFSMFRIYAGPDNLPAEYSEDNKPYTPKHFLPISLDGVEEGDFTMVFGFPGRTDEYLPGTAVAQIKDVLNPARIEIRETALSIIDKYMRSDEQIRLQYASKYARVANYWKKWIGESQGLERTNALARKEKYEDEFEANCDPKYNDLLAQMNIKYTEIQPLALAKEYYSEIASRNIEVMRMVSMSTRLGDVFKKNGLKGYDDYLDRVDPFLTSFYKDYRPEIDQEVFAALTQMYCERMSLENIPSTFRGMRTKEQFEAKAKELYSTSIFTDEKRMNRTLQASAEVAIENISKDPLFVLGAEWSELYDNNISGPYNKIKTRIDVLQRHYMKAQMETFPKKAFYPDANSTMRVTYGKVASYSPKDAITYNPVTYLDGVIEKYVPNDYEFDVSAKLLQLYNDKDYGQYADKNGKIPVCFIGTNHTTGGNSGSPAIDANGNLIGLNFDRAWEGVMSDINYDPSICRNIMVDARYILFIIDKYAGATNLIKEMKLVHPKGLNQDNGKLDKKSKSPSMDKNAKSRKLGKPNKRQ